tara:strand:- start:3180 stop:3812 length:633 start_codon:yes stop_codon:yes gene_type:complete
MTDKREPHTSKYAPDPGDPRLGELADQIDATRESIRNVKRFWKRFAISCFAFVALLSTYICVSGLNLWDKNIEVNKLYQDDVAKLLTQLGEANAEKEELYDRLEAEQARTQHHRTLYQKTYRKHREQALVVRNFLMTYHVAGKSPALMRQLSEWWTHQHLRKDREFPARRFSYGQILVEQLERTWTDGNPRFGRRNENQSGGKLVNAEAN